MTSLPVRRLSPWYWVVFAVALVARFYALLVVNPGTALYSDMANYDTVAMHLQFGMRTAGDTFFPIGYPAFLALAYAVGGRNFILIGVVQAIMGALTCLLVYLSALRVSQSNRVAFAAGVIASVYPPLIYYGSLLLTEAVAPLWCTLALWLLLEADDLSSRPRALALSAMAGVAWSVAAVVRPNLLLLLPVMALFPYLGRRNGGHWLRVLTMVGCALPLVVLVSFSNSRLLGRPAGLSTNGGVNFFLMQADVYRLYTPDSTWSPVRNNLRYSEVFRSRALSTNESFYYREGIKRLRARPDKARHFLENVLEGFGLGIQGYWPANQGFSDDSFEYARFRQILRLCSRGFLWALVLPCWIYAIFARRAMDRAMAAPWLLACLLTATLALTFAIFLADPRIHLPLDPILIAFSTMACLQLVTESAGLFRSGLRQRRSAL